MGEVIRLLSAEDVPARAVQFPYNGPLPQGGRRNVEKSVAEIFLAQTALLCAPDGSQQFELALRRRDELLRNMDDAQRGYLASVANAIGRLAMR